MMKRIWPTLLAIVLTGASALAQGAAAAGKTPDVLRNAVDPYVPGVERGRYFRAAGVDNELSAEEFAADRKRTSPFVRGFDHWPMLIGFDKNANGTVDWFEADAYRREVRKKVIEAFDTNDDRKLSPAERAAANKALTSERFLAARLGRGGPPAVRRLGGGGEDRGLPPVAIPPAEAQAVRRQIDVVMTERRALQRKLYDVQRTIESSDALADLRQEAAAASKAAREAEESSREIAAAREAQRAASRALREARDERLASNPDARAIQQRIEELDHARAAWGLKGAIADLTLTHRDSPIGSALAKDAKLTEMRSAVYRIRDYAARKEATKAYNAARTAAVAELPGGKALIEEIAACREQVAAHEKAIRDTRSKLYELQRTLDRGEPTKALADAYARLRAASAAIREAQKGPAIAAAIAARTDTWRAMQARTRQLLAEDRQGAALQARIKELETAYRELRSRAQGRRPMEDDNRDR